MRGDDGLHGFAVRKLDIVEETPAQKSVGQLLLIVRGDDHQRAQLRPHRLPGFVNMELHAVELQQQVVGKLDVGLVDLVDQQHHALLAGEGVPNLAALDIGADVGDPGIAQLESRRRDTASYS